MPLFLIGSHIKTSCAIFYLHIDHLVRLAAHAYSASLITYQLHYCDTLLACFMLYVCISLKKVDVIE